MSNKNKLRPLGEVLLDMETIMTEMVEGHDLQHGDVYGLVKSYLDVHHPQAREVYVEDGSNPEFYYGPQRKQGRR